VPPTAATLPEVGQRLSFASWTSVSDVCPQSARRVGEPFQVPQVPPRSFATWLLA